MDQGISTGVVFAKPFYSLLLCLLHLYNLLLSWLPSVVCVVLLVSVLPGVPQYMDVEVVAVAFEVPVAGAVVGQRR